MSVPRVQSVTRAAALLEAIRRRPDGASTATLARDADLAPATAGRLLATLADAGLVRRAGSDAGSVRLARSADAGLVRRAGSDAAAVDRGRADPAVGGRAARWVLGDALVQLARHADPHGALARRTAPTLQRLAAAGRESALLAVPRPGPDVRVVAQVDGPWLLGITDWVGRPVALHASAAGKLLLAELAPAALRRWLARADLTRLTDSTLATPAAVAAALDRVRDTGWATLEDESEPGLSSVAMAVRDADGTLTGMLGFSGPSHRFDADRLLGPLRDGVAELERR